MDENPIFGDGGEMGSGSPREQGIIISIIDGTFSY
jgi:hypothetical protein